MQEIQCTIKNNVGSIKEVTLIANIHTDSEIKTLLYGGIMQKVMSNIYSDNK